MFCNLISRKPAQRVLPPTGKGETVPFFGRRLQILQMSEVDIRPARPKLVVTVPEMNLACILLVVWSQWW